jgi:uncharacterized protein YcbK (DUF882 family)
MPFHRLVRIAAVVLGLLVPAFVLPTEAHARSKSKSSVSKHVKKKGARGKGRGKFIGHGVPQTALREAPLPKPSGRVVVVSRNVHAQADVNIYNEDGSFNQVALATLDRVFRCRRTGEERAIDPRLYEILSIVYDRYGKTIEVNSGFRYQRNEGSRHFHGSAIDISIDGVNWRELFAFASSLDSGGMGIGRYPRNNFVHIDFRAPGEPSYRWTDTKRSRRADPGKAPSKMWRRSARPNT